MRDRFSPEHALGLHLTIGLLVILLAGWCFSEIAETLGPSVPALDQQVATWFHEHARSGLTTTARVITFFGSAGFLTSVSVCCAVLLIRVPRWDWLLTLALTMLGGSLLNIVLKHFFQRQRPILENPLVTLTTFGFPSGHTMGSTLFYGLLALFAAHALRALSAKIAACALAVMLVMLIGLTRIYLGAHYLSDVLAAMAAGLAWLAFCWAGVETFRKERRRHPR